MLPDAMDVLRSSLAICHIASFFVEIINYEQCVNGIFL